MGQERHSKDDAYRLADLESHKRYYDEWAESYDLTFADESGYMYPEIVANRFLELAGPEDTPVADLGCGTGLAGLAFAGTGLLIDGFDVSEGMLKQAEAKGVYRRLQTTDLTKRSGLPHRIYGGLISCGTFTLGHLGPADLETSLIMARRKALCLIGINAKHFEERGFGALLNKLEAKGDINCLRVEVEQIFSDGDMSDNINVAKLAIFRMAK